MNEDVFPLKVVIFPCRVNFQGCKMYQKIIGKPHDVFLQRSAEFDHISSKNGYAFFKNSVMGGFPQKMLHMHYPFNSNSM